MKRWLQNWYARLPIIHGLRFRLVLLVLLASLPALGLLYYTASQQRHDALNAGQQEANSLASLAAADQRRIIDQNNRYLATLARLPELQDDQMAACNSLVRALLNDNEYAYQNIGIITPDGNIPCQAGGPLPTFFSESPARLQAALAAPQMTIGDIQGGAGQPIDETVRVAAPSTRTITYVYPVRNSAGVADRLVFVSLPFVSLERFAGQANPPDGTIFRVLDKNGLVIAQYSTNTKAATTTLLATPAPEGTPQPGRLLSDEHGNQFLYARAEVDVPSDIRNAGVSVVSVAVPRDEIVRRADSLFQENVGRLAVVAVLAVVAAWIGADLFRPGNADARKRIVGQWYQVFSTGDLERIDELTSRNFVDHSRVPGQAAGRDGVKQVIVAFRTAFPDGQLTVRELLADHDKVVARVTLVGTHVGEFFGTPPSGKLVASEGNETFRFSGSTIVETWSLFGPLVAVRTTKEAPAAKPPRTSFWRRLRWWSKDEPPAEVEPDAP